MKLELKHLAPYLAYGLQKYCPTSNILLHDYLPLDFIQSTIDLHFSFGWKPILRPMSDFDKMGLAGEDYYSYVSKVNKEVLGDWFVDRDLDFEIDSHDETSYFPAKVAYRLYEFLFANHFDVFGLIDKGLAIDINTLSE